MVFANQHDKLLSQDAEGAQAGYPVGGLVKRGLDVAFALVALVVLAPLFALVSLLVLASGGWPIFCRQRRVGYGGQIFACYRFRTTVQPVDDTFAGEPRITPVGRVLSASGIEKLPQLINVLKGEMSCVGPRPMGPVEVQRYAGEAGAYFRARPGMTGVTQLTTRDALPLDDQFALEASYVRNWSMRSDIVILLRAIPAAVRAEGTA